MKISTIGGQIRRMRSVAVLPQIDAPPPTQQPRTAYRKRHKEQTRKVSVTTDAKNYAYILRPAGGWHTWRGQETGRILHLRDRRRYIQQIGITPPTGYSMRSADGRRQQVVQLLTEIRDNQRAQMEVASTAIKRSHRGMRIVLVWLLLFLGFVVYFAYDAHQKYEELKERQEEALGEFEA